MTTPKPNHKQNKSPTGSQISVDVNCFAKTSRNAKTSIRVVDVFAGAGGFGLGFSLAGAQMLAAIEIDQWAAETLTTNNPDVHVIRKDIRSLSKQDIRAFSNSVDVLIGGPPCQGFSHANQSTKKFLDPRNSLFVEFIRIAKIIKPQVLLMENVPGLATSLSSQGSKTLDTICEEFRRLGFITYSKVIQASDFGVPQRRPRLFILGTRKPWAQPFPEKTHGVETDCSTLLSLPTRRKLLRPVSTWEAISDLPRLRAREGEEVMELQCEPKNLYQALLRGNTKKVFNHKAMKHTDRLVKRFAQLAWGQSGGSLDCAETGPRLRGSPDKQSLKPYDQNNRRMYPHKPCHTLPASFYANFVHPYQHRNFTPREGARLQSFPDWYIFKGRGNVPSFKLLAREGRASEQFLGQYNQIGNAVPPLLAFHLATHVIKNLKLQQG